jgi:membrane fusion protein, multidrug efflux system
MLKKIAITAGGLLAVLGVVIGIYVLMIMKLIASAKGQVMPAEPVTTAVATAQQWDPVITSVGSLSAVQGVTVAAQLDGNVVKIAFEAGAAVKAGDLLVQQDVSLETAQLEAAQAASELARINLARSRQLLSRATISQQQYDSDLAVSRQAEAQVRAIEATIDKKTIRAPFSGRLGIRLVNLGQTLRAGDPIVSLQSLRPIFADFSLPQQSLAEVAPGMAVRIRLGQGKAGREASGIVTAINPDVDSATRNVRIQATVANDDESLRPGMFVDVDVILPHKQEVLVIPATSVLYAPYGDSVFTVVERRDDKTGEVSKVLVQKFVRLGAHRGDYVAVTSGLSAGDTVVTTGVFKLRNGIHVAVHNELAPAMSVDPTPDDS